MARHAVADSAREAATLRAELRTLLQDPEAIRTKPLKQGVRQQIAIQDLGGAWVYGQDRAKDVASAR